MTPSLASSRGLPLRNFRLPLAGLVILIGATTVFGEEDLGASIAERMKEIFSFNRAAVVKIQSTDQHGRIEGTGFYADPSGTIYTTINALGDGQEITVCQGMRKMPAHLLIADPRTGVALIKIDATTPFIPIGDSSKLEVSSPLVAIGYPTDRPICPSFGLVAGFDKEYLGLRFHTTHVRANLPVQPGLGGAPALNLKGEVVGIVVAAVDGNAGCYLLPINAAEKMRSDYANFGKLKPGYVGITVESSNDPSKPSTARVAELQSGESAALAGLKKGDLLLRVGDIAIRTPEDIFDASFYLTGGASTTVTVLREGKEQQFTIRPAETASGAPAPEEVTDLSLDNPSGIIPTSAH